MAPMRRPFLILFASAPLPWLSFSIQELKSVSEPLMRAALKTHGHKGASPGRALAEGRSASMNAFGRSEIVRRQAARLQRANPLHIGQLYAEVMNSNPVTNTNPKDFKLPGDTPKEKIENHKKAQQHLQGWKPLKSASGAQAVERTAGKLDSGVPCLEDHEPKGSQQIGQGTTGLDVEGCQELCQVEEEPQPCEVWLFNKHTAECKMYGFTSDFEAVQSKQYSGQYVTGDVECSLTASQQQQSSSSNSGTTTEHPTEKHEEDHEEEHSAEHDGVADNPLVVGQNPTSKDEIEAESNATSLMISELSLYCCCEPLKVSKDWQYNLFVKNPTPDWCKEDWFMSHCVDLDNVYSPSGAIRDISIDVNEQVKFCDMCNECFSKDCPFWTKDQQPMHPEWIKNISCAQLAQASNNLKEEDEIGDRENEDVKDADACANAAIQKNESAGKEEKEKLDETVNSTRCPGKVEEIAKKAPWLLIITAAMIALICCSMGSYGLWRYKEHHRRLHKKELIAKGRKKHDSSDEEPEGGQQKESTKK